MTLLLASIPSPESGVIDLGPVSVRGYGLMLLLGILAATFLTGVRWTRWGGDWDLIFACAMWGVAGGIVGARLYHVATSWEEVPDEWWGVFAVWKGGLGVWGGMAGGVLVGALVVKRAGADVYRMMEAVAPGLLLAQAIGRVGNYFNQELFGTPSELPWALEISPDNRPVGYESFATFHPIFLYELVWNLLGVALLLWLGARLRLRPPGLFCLYVAYYTLARATWEENLRIDPSHHFAGLRLNNWIAIGVLLAALVALVWSQRRPLAVAAGGPPGRKPARWEALPKMALPKGRVRRRR